MEDISNLWLDSEVVWAAAQGPLTEDLHRELARRALALAARSGHWRLLFDFRRAALSHDVLTLNRHAEWLSRADVPLDFRVSLLCRHHTPDCEFWAQVLRVRGIIAAVFTDADHAVRWLRGDLAAG
jgi:hypothetical protein